MKGYFQLFSKSHIAMLFDWLEQSGELWMHVEFPYSGSSGTWYRLLSLHHVKEVLDSLQESPPIEITIFQDKLFALRGIAGKEILEAASKQITDDEEFTVVELGEGRAFLEWIASDKGLKNLEKILQEVTGRSIAIGLDPTDVTPFDDNWARKNRDCILRISIRTNSLFYEPLVDNPTKYENIISLLTSLK